MSQATTTTAAPRKRKAKSPVKGLIIAACCSITALLVIISKDPVTVNMGQKHGRGLLNRCYACLVFWGLDLSSVSLWKAWDGRRCWQHWFGLLCGLAIYATSPVRHSLPRFSPAPQPTRCS